MTFRFDNDRTQYTILDNKTKGRGKGGRNHIKDRYKEIRGHNYSKTNIYIYILFFTLF